MGKILYIKSIYYNRWGITQDIITMKNICESYRDVWFPVDELSAFLAKVEAEVKKNKTLGFQVNTTADDTRVSIWKRGEAQYNATMHIGELNQCKI